VTIGTRRAHTGADEPADVDPDLVSNPQKVRRPRGSRARSEPSGRLSVAR
jgi:hypothetical protein